MLRRYWLIIGLSLIAIVSGTVALYQSHHAIKFSSAASVRQLPERYGCQASGQVTTPVITILQLPPGSKSWAFLLEDLDGTGQSRVQWLVFNIPTSITVIPENAGTPGTIAKNLQGVYGYAPPCPPVGVTHRYRLHLYSLDVDQLSTVTADTTEEKFLTAIKNHLLNQTASTFRFVRSR